MVRQASAGAARRWGHLVSAADDLAAENRELRQQLADAQRRADANLEALIAAADALLTIRRKLEQERQAARESIGKAV